jgi:hypothetical protein
MDPRLDLPNSTPERLAALSQSALAARLGADASGLVDAAPAPWSKAEEVACVARAVAGQRCRNIQLIERAVEDFGGLPTHVDWTTGQHGLGKEVQTHRLGVARLAARDPTGFGFEVFARGLRGSRPWDEFLLEGLSSSLADREFQGRQTPELGRAGPVVACLMADNAPALGRLLSMPDAFEALMSCEPGVAQTPWPRERWDSVETAMAGAERFAKTRQESGLFLERSMLWQAFSFGALKCAGLLLELPAFAAVLGKGELGMAWGPRVATVGSAYASYRMDFWSAVACEGESRVARGKSELSADQKRDQLALRLELALKIWEASTPEARLEEGPWGHSWGERLVFCMWRLDAADLARQAGEAFESLGCPMNWDVLGKKMQKHPRFPASQALAGWCQAKAQRSALEKEAVAAKPGVAKRVL